MFKHLVFYDGTCGFCDRIVDFLYKSDTQKKFAFAPLEGETAEEALKDVPAEQKNADSMILIENYKQPDQRTLVLGKAGLRTAWLLAGWWRLLGVFYFIVPAFITDFVYRIVARNRHRFFGRKECSLPPREDQERFLK